jgi:hypothetical protein
VVGLGLFWVFVLSVSDVVGFAVVLGVVLLEVVGMFEVLVYLGCVVLGYVCVVVGGVGVVDLVGVGVVVSVCAVVCDCIVVVFVLVVVVGGWVDVGGY